MFPILITALCLSSASVTVSGVVSRETNTKDVFLGYIVHQQINSFGDTKDFHVATTTGEQEDRLRANVGKEVRVTGQVGTRSFMRVMLVESIDEVPHPPKDPAIKTLIGYVVVGNKDGVYFLDASPWPTLGMMNYLVDTDDPAKREQLRSAATRRVQVRIVGRVSSYPPTHGNKVRPETIESLGKPMNPEIVPDKR